MYRAKLRVMYMTCTNASDLVRSASAVNGDDLYPFSSVCIKQC